MYMVVVVDVVNTVRCMIRHIQNSSFRHGSRLCECWDGRYGTARPTTLLIEGRTYFRIHRHARTHAPTHLRGRLVVDAAHVRQKDQELRVGLLGHQRRERVVVREDRRLRVALVGAHRVVLVDDGDDALRVVLGVEDRCLSDQSISHAVAVGRSVARLRQSTK